MSNAIQVEQKTIPLEIIKWADHWSETKIWIEIEAAPKLEAILINTVGWVIKEDKKGILIVSTYGENDCYSHSTYILKANIVERRKLR